MPLTVAAKHVALDAVRAAGTHQGLFTKAADIVTVTGITSTDTLTKTSHGLTNGDVVIISAKTGATGLVIGDPYFVIGVTTNTFQLSLLSGGAAVDLVTDLTDATLAKWTELTGGSPAYARKTIAWNAAAGSIVDDSTNGNNFDVPAAANVDGQSLHTALTVGTLLGIFPVTRETFAAQGVYTSTDVKITGAS